MRRIIGVGGHAKPQANFDAPRDQYPHRGAPKLACGFARAHPCFSGIGWALFVLGSYLALPSARSRRVRYSRPMSYHPPSWKSTTARLFQLTVTTRPTTS